MSSRFFTIVLILIILAAGVVWYVRSSDAVTPPAGQPTTNTPPQRVLQTYSNPKYGLTFSYPDTYQLEERDTPGSALREHHIITLIQKKDLPPPQGGESPPSITIDVIQNNLDAQTTEQWIRNSSVSNFKLASEGKLSTTTLGTTPALSYRWSGLYEGTTVAVARPQWVYAFSVTYLEMGADIVQDFVALRRSVQFTSGSVPGATTTRQ